MIPASTPKSTILERLAQGEVLISDGASGTYLQQHGLEPGGCPEALNEAQPEIVKGMAAAFFEAGSDLVLTNSFGGSKFVLKNYGLAGRVRELNRLAAKHARGEAPAGCFIVGSLGPSGEFLEPLGSVSEDEMVEAFHEQIEALVEGGVDAVLIETMTALEEATLAVRTAREFSGLPVFCSMTFDKGPRGYFTMMGVTPTQAVAGLRDAGADVVGTNCGSGIVDTIAVFREMREADDGHLLVQSNAGIPIFQGGELVYPDSPEIMVEHYQTLLKEGVSIVGGCCGTGPGHIRSLAALAGRNQARTKR